MPETLQLNAPLRTVSVVGGLNAPNGHNPSTRGANPQSSPEVQAAYDNGVREGEKRLGEQLMQQRAECLELEMGVLKSLRECVPQVAHECECELVTLAIEAAGRLVAGIPVSAEMVEAAVREVLAQVEEAAEISVSVHPDDLALLQKNNSPLLTPASGGLQIQFRGSPDVARGSCLAQTRFGVIDARRETKLELLKKAVRS